ncbi:hypothetical protein [Myroides sp. LJL119]
MRSNNISHTNFRSIEKLDITSFVWGRTVGALLFLENKFQKQRQVLYMFFLSIFKSRYTNLQEYIQSVGCVTDRLLYNKGLLYYKVLSSLV